MKKELYVVSGCNGAGKTAASNIIFEQSGYEYVNADEIEKGVIKSYSINASIDAGKLMIKRIEKLLLEGKSFGFETTLSGKVHLERILRAKELGYNVTLFYYWLSSVETAKERVGIRVEEGGHNVPTNIIEQRYYRGIKNLFSLYLPVVDKAIIYDNSYYCPPIKIAVYENNKTVIIDKNTYNQLLNLYRTLCQKQK